MKKKLLMIITIIKVALLASALFLVSCNERSDTATPSGDDTPITDASCTFVFTPGEDPEDGEENPFDEKTGGICSVKGDVATFTTTLAFEGENVEYTISINQANGTFKASIDETDEITGKVTVSNDGKKWEWVFLNSIATLEITGDISGGDTSGGDTATAEGKVLFKEGNNEFGDIYAGVTNMTCTLEVEEAGKSPITYNGICGKNNVEGFIAFYDKEDNPSVSARLIVPHNQYPAEEIEYSEAEAIKEKNPTATTKVSRENNVWEGKITDGGTDLLKLTITTEDIVVAAPADSKPCQLVNKIIGYVKINNYTLDGNCVLARDANDAVTKLDFTSSLANPPVTSSLPIGEKQILVSRDKIPLVKDVYRIGGYLYNGIGNTFATIDFNNDNDNTFTTKANYTTIYEFDIVLK